VSGSFHIERGDKFTVTKDYDGYDAVKVTNSVWVEEPRWITVSAEDSDQEESVRSLANALTRLADRMAAARR